MDLLDGFRRTTSTAVDGPPVAGGVVASFAPGMAYLAVHPMFGSVGGMLVASLVAIGLVIARARRGQAVGTLVPATLAYLALRTAAGLLTGSETIYFGFGLALSATTALVVAATAWTATPAASHLIPPVVRYQFVGPQDAIHRRVAAQVTVAWSVAELAMTAIELRHLLRATGSEFVLARTTVALPAMAGVVFLLVFYVRARLDPVEHRRAHQHDRGRSLPPASSRRISASRR